MGKTSNKNEIVLADGRVIEFLDLERDGMSTKILRHLLNLPMLSAMMTGSNDYKSGDSLELAPYIIKCVKNKDGKILSDTMDIEEIEALDYKDGMMIFNRAMETLMFLKKA